VNFVDYTLVRLADVTTRAALFDSDSLELLTAAGYAEDAATLTGPYAAVFDEVQIGLSIPRRSTIEGQWAQIGSSDRSEARLVISGLGRDSTVRLDALWRGSIVARIAPASGRIADVISQWPDPNGIDAEIIAALGSLPSDPAALEHERRVRFLGRIRAALSEPAALTDAIFDRWLARVGAQSVGDLMTNFRNVLATGALKISYSDPTHVEASPRPLPVTVALLIRDAPISLADLMADSKLVREHLVEAGVERARDSATNARAPLLVAWIVPETVFDDADWPGGTSGTPDQKRLTRRRAAAQWLGPEGIALIAAPKHP
jgi:hypothetical protein